MIWAEFETYKVKDNEKMKEVMEKTVRVCEGDQIYWNLYVQYSKYFGIVKDIRSIYKKAIEYVKEDKLAFSQYWIAWEKL